MDPSDIKQESTQGLDSVTGAPRSTPSSQLQVANVLGLRGIRRRYTALYAQHFHASHSRLNVGSAGPDRDAIFLALALVGPQASSSRLQDCLSL